VLKPENIVLAKPLAAEKGCLDRSPTGSLIPQFGAESVTIPAVVREAGMLTHSAPRGSLLVVLSFLPIPPAGRCGIFMRWYIRRIQIPQHSPSGYKGSRRSRSRPDPDFFISQISGEIFSSPRTGSLSLAVLPECSRIPLQEGILSFNCPDNQ